MTESARCNLSIFSLTCKQKTPGTHSASNLHSRNDTRKKPIAILDCFHVKLQGAVLGFNHLTIFTLGHKTNAQAHIRPVIYIHEMTPEKKHIAI